MSDCRAAATAAAFTALAASTAAFAVAPMRHRLKLAAFCDFAFILQFMRSPCRTTTLRSAPRKMRRVRWACIRRERCSGRPTASTAVPWRCFRVRPATRRRGRCARFSRRPLPPPSPCRLAARWRRG